MRFLADCLVAVSVEPVQTKHVYRYQTLGDVILNFEEFDPQIGVEGYCKAIRKMLFPKSTATSIDAAAFGLEYKIFPKGSVFSRVRPIKTVDLDKFLNGTVERKEFHPPMPNTAPVSIGRFNSEGERKLYLADHPYVALRECGIQPGDYFLFSYFSFSEDARLVDANSGGSEFSKLLHALFQTQDSRFYEVINHVYGNYLKFDGFHGVSYNSVKVKKGFQDETWGEINSSTNLAMAASDFQSADLVAGWLAQCDDSYRPSYFRSFKWVDSNQRNELAALTFHGNESEFIADHSQVMDELKQLRAESTRRIARKEYDDPTLQPFKMLFKDE